MQQQQLIHESINDAIRECILAIGGYKPVGLALKPELPADQAGQYVRDRLNPERRERFSPEQLLWILREARKARCHAGMRFLATEAGYAEPVPLDPQDEQAQLMRQFIEAQRQIQALASRMERIGLVRSAA